MVNAIYRPYKKSDYAQCESLVNQAWGFDELFLSPALAQLAKQLYTKGSYFHSTFRRVAEVDGRVVGFIFGFNEMRKKPSGLFFFGLKVIWKWLFLKSTGKNNKNELAAAMQAHEDNKKQVLHERSSEIVLFVVDKAHQGKGLGKKLWTFFKEDCQKDGVASIVVETNKLGASRFYELLGFKHLQDFDSPLHALATPEGHACIYVYQLDYSFVKEAV